VSWYVGELSCKLYNTVTNVTLQRHVSTDELTRQFAKNELAVSQSSCWPVTHWQQIFCKSTEILHNICTL